MKMNSCKVCLGCLAVMAAVYLGMSPIRAGALEDGVYNVKGRSFVSQDDVLTEVARQDHSGAVMPDGAYEIDGNDYYVEGGQFLSRQFRNGVYYTSVEIAASNRLYEFPEEADQRFWEAVKELENGGNGRTAIPIEYGFSNETEGLLYAKRINHVLNLSDVFLKLSMSGRGADGSYRLYLQNSEENRAAVKEIREGSELLTRIYEERIKGIEGERERLETIYDWVVCNLEYDDTLKNKKGYKGLTEGKTVCGGYAQIFYWLCEMAGIDVEYVYGARCNLDGSFGDSDYHAWNRVRLTGTEEYGYCDATWEPGDRAERGMPRQYFMRNLAEFERQHLAFWTFH